MHARFVYKPRDDVSLCFILIQMFGFHYRGHLLWDACEAALLLLLLFFLILPISVKVQLLTVNADAGLSCSCRQQRPR